MRRRSASSVRSSGRKRVESARSHRYVERSLSACSGMSRPGTAPASRSRIEQAEEPARFEPVGRQEASLETKDMVMPTGGAEIEEATSVHEEEQGRKQGYCCHASFEKNCARVTALTQKLFHTLLSTTYIAWLLACCCFYSIPGNLLRRRCLGCVNLANVTYALLLCVNHVQ